MANNMILKMIRQESKDLKISMKRLCYGICSSAYLSKCINEDLEMDKLMLEALLQRLGISTRRYTFVLRDSEYACFECREKARNHIWQGEYQKAEECLEQYIQIQTEMKSAKHLHSQATALLRSYIIADKQNSFAEQLRNVEEGLAATNAKLEEVDFVTNSYSEIELLLILRGAMIWSHMGQTEKAIKLYKQFYQLQKVVPYTTNEFEHIFAKVNYEMAKYYLSQKEYKKVMEIAADSIKLLAESNKFLFMWELMEMYLKAEENAPEVEGLAENRDVFDNYIVLKSVVGRYYKNWNADEHCPMYYEYEIYSLRKMISQRRKLMGETQESISRKVNCDYATIERLERGLNDTQTGIRYALLNEIGLPIEKCFYMVIADNMQVRRDYFNYMLEIAKGNIDEAKKLLEKVENSLDLSVIINKQAMEIQKLEDEKTKDEKRLLEYQEKAMNILCETLPESYLDSLEGGLLYGNEENILRRIIMNCERRKDIKSASELTIKVLNGYRKPQVVGDEFVGVSLGFSRMLESMSANAGNFKRADKLVKNNLGKCVQHDMAGLLTFWLYDACWNKEKQHKRMTKRDFYFLDVAITIAALQGYQSRCTRISRYKEEIIAKMKDLNQK